MSDPTMLERIQQDLVASMKARDADTTSTLRMLKAALMEAKTRKAKDEQLGADEEIAVLRRYVKQRREALESMQTAGDAARQASEEREIVITERYLPAAMSDEAIETLVAEAIAATGAAGPKDMGKVIGAVMAKVKGRADGNAVSRIVKAKLAP
jgi:uncharacterized protein YqeY